MEEQAHIPWESTLISHTKHSDEVQLLQASPNLVEQRMHSTRSDD